MPRNVSGTYSLPLPPVVANTVIQAAWGNTTTDDIAQGITDSLDRQGRGGMIAPFRLTDGTVLQPAWAFNAETGTGMYREGAGILSLAVMGVKVGQFAAAGFTGTLAGPFSITGAISFAGAVNVAGRALFADGTVALPSIGFTSDLDTGIYKPALGQLGLGADGVLKLSMDANTVQVRPSPTASAPSLLLFAGTNAGGPGYALDILGSGVGVDQAIVRWLNNGYTIERLAIKSDSGQITFSVPGALPMVFTTSNITRLTIAAAGTGTYTGIFNVTGAHVAAPNFWVSETTAGAGTVGVSGALGSSTVYWGNTSAGLGAMDLNAGGIRHLTITPVASTVNYWTLSGGATGNRVLMNANGADTNVGIQWATKGTGDYAYFGNGGVHFQILCTSTGARWIQVAGASSTTNPTITANGGGVHFSTTPVYASGVNVAPAGDSQSHAGAYASLFADNIRFQDWTNAADNRTSEFRWGGTFSALRVLNDAYNAAVNWAISVGGYGTGVSEVKFNLSNAGAAETAVLRAVRTAASVFNVGVGTLTPGYQLQVAGTGQISTTGTVFDLASTSTSGGGCLYLGDLGNAAGNGGCIMFGAFPTPVAAGQHFAAIKACITDASGFTAGELFLCTKNTSADTGSTAALRLTAGKVLYDSRNLPIARDPGATGGTTPPIGSIVIGSPTGNISALAGTVTPSGGSPMTIFATGSGTNTTITGGTWRNCGALSSTSSVALWIRIA